MMRYRTIIAALLAGTIVTPALAQDDLRAESRAERQAERQERIDRGDLSIRRQEGMRSPEQMERRQQRMNEAAQAQAQAPVQAPVQAPAQAEVQGQVQAPVQQQPERPMRRMDGNGGASGVINPQQAPDGANRGWQRRQLPTVIGEPSVAREDNRGWRGNNNGGWRGNNNGGWQRGDRDGDVIPNGRDWDRDNDGIPNSSDRDRDNDGIRNNRDRDRDNDGIRNNRDWDRNNDGRIDRRWDGNNNGVIDRRYDRNGDGVRDNRDYNNGSRWSDNQRWNNNQSWNRDWRNDRRYDWQRYRYSNRSLFEQPRYYSPYGNSYRYQRFSIGIYLNQIFFGSRYHIGNPGQYRLPYAQWPYQWVRYYDDVLLVDTRNGYIVDVIHEFFW